ADQAEDESEAGLTGEEGESRPGLGRGEQAVDVGQGDEERSVLGEGPNDGIDCEQVDEKGHVPAGATEGRGGGGAPVRVACGETIAGLLRGQASSLSEGPSRASGDGFDAAKRP